MSSVYVLLTWQNKIFFLNGWHFLLLALWPSNPAGVSLNSIIVYCANQKDMDLWFSLLKENIEANGGTAIAPENYTRVRVSAGELSLKHSDLSKKQKYLCKEQRYCELPCYITVKAGACHTLTGQNTYFQTIIHTWLCAFNPPDILAKFPPASMKQDVRLCKYNESWKITACFPWSLGFYTGRGLTGIEIYFIPALASKSLFYINRWWSQLMKPTNLVVSHMRKMAEPLFRNVEKKHAWHPEEKRWGVHF